jgi:hypothetical protein
MRCRSSLARTRCDPRRRVSVQPSRVSAARTRQLSACGGKGTGGDHSDGQRAPTSLACLRATWASDSGRIGQLVEQRSTEDRLKQTFMLVRGGGQGRGRTADLPIFRAKDASPPSPARVRDLHSSTDPNAAELGRTHADETKDEPTRAPVAMWQPLRSSTAAAPSTPS